MKHRPTVAVLFIAIAVMFSAGCASKWHAAYGIAAWTNKNMDSLEQWYEKGSDEEKAFLRAYVNPPMNIMKHGCLAIEAMERGDDIALANEIVIITKIGAGWGKSFPGLLDALKTKDVEKATQQLQGIQLYVQEQAGIEKPLEDKGWIRSTWDKIW